MLWTCPLNVVDDVMYPGIEIKDRFAIGDFARLHFRDIEQVCKQFGEPGELPIHFGKRLGIILQALFFKRALQQLGIAFQGGHRRS